MCAAEIQAGLPGMSSGKRIKKSNHPAGEVREGKLGDFLDPPGSWKLCTYI